MSTPLEITDVQDQHVMLEKDEKPICRIRCVGLQFPNPRSLSIFDFKPKARLNNEYIEKLPCFQLYPAPDNPIQKREWATFTDWISKKRMVGLVESESCKFYILPPIHMQEVMHLDVLYVMKISDLTYNKREIEISGPHDITLKAKGLTSASPRQMKMEISPPTHHTCLQAPKPSRVDVNSLQQEHVGDSNYGFHPTAPVRSSNQKLLLNPTYLRTLSQTHGWIFGAIAELVDNSRDAKATRMDIYVESLYLKSVGKEVPVLCITDDGHGMSHTNLVRMLSLGHKEPDIDDPDHIGRFGVGFKTGSMRLGRDTLVLTQTSSSRSIALLSQSFNENNENLEVPIVTYCRYGNYMDLDLSIQSKDSATSQLEAIKDFSPFNEYLIGEKFVKFTKQGTGTQIYIWNLDKWGSDYTLEWEPTKIPEDSSEDSDGDILIRSRKIRRRGGQISQKVPLDYSLKAYLEVIFLDPRIKIYVQGSLVKSHPLAKSLSKTVIVTGHVMNEPIQLTLGISQEEWERVNCGIFLYWHGRLIEAYRRVGGMEYNADMGRGVIGVVDVSNIMDVGNGRVWVLNNKQGFQDCEAYSKLLEWLGNKTDEYWDSNFDKLDLWKGTAKHKPDHEWVQCDKCRKWRILNAGFDSRSLTKQWFCYMPPFSGKCETPEQDSEPGVITVSSKRLRDGTQQSTAQQDAEPGVTTVSSKRVRDGTQQLTAQQDAEPGVNTVSSKRVRDGTRQLTAQQDAEPGVITVSSKRVRDGTQQLTGQRDATEVANNCFSNSGRKERRSKQSECSSEDESRKDDPTWMPTEGRGIERGKSKQFGSRFSGMNVKRGDYRENSRKKNNGTPNQPNSRKPRKTMWRNDD